MVPVIHSADWPRQAYDVENDGVYQNLGSELGLLKALALCLRLKPLGLLYGGVPCELFGFMASNTHCRSGCSPWGNPYTFVFEGNVLCTRFCLLAIIATVRAAVWCLENPLRSTIDTLPPVQYLMKPFLGPLMVKW